MKSIPFGTELYYAKYEFSTPYLLSVSDCETLTVAELLTMANLGLNELAEISLGYTESAGHPELRMLVASKYERVNPDQVIVLGTPIEGIYLVMQALLEPGDEVIVLTPAYDALINIPEQCGVKVHRWSLVATDDGWEMDWPLLEQLLSEKSKLIIVNFPHNPTGYLPPVSQFSELVDITDRYGAWLFVDEMYRGLEFDLTRLLPSAVDRYERSIILSGLSKTHGLPGLRSGWLITQDEVLRQNIMNWKYYTSICPPAPSEFLAMAALSAGDPIVARNRDILSKNLVQAGGFFERWNKLFTWRPPQAGSVALVGLGVPSATAYCHELAREAGVLLLPATFMGYDDQHVRFGFGRRSFTEALHQYEDYLLAAR